MRISKVLLLLAMTGSVASAQPAGKPSSQKSLDRGVTAAANAIQQLDRVIAQNEEDLSKLFAGRGFKFMKAAGGEGGDWIKPLGSGYTGFHAGKDLNADRYAEALLETAKIIVDVWGELDPRVKLGKAGASDNSVFAGSGLMYDAVISTTEKGSQVGLKMAVRVWASGSHLRADIVQIAGTRASQTRSVLSLGGSEPPIVLYPATREYSKLTGVTSQHPVKQEIVKLIDKPAGRLLGFSVRHYRLRARLSLEDQRSGDMSNRADVLDDVWVTADLNVQALIVPAPRSALATVVPQFEPIILPNGNEINGFQLRRRTSITFAGVEGRTDTLQMEMTVTQARVGDVAESTFEVPNGYKEVPYRPLPLPLRP